MNAVGDDRSPISKAVGIASQITTIGMMMVIPAIGGYFLDQWLGTYVLLTVVGLFLGVASAAIQLSRLVRHLNAETSQQTNGGGADEFETDEVEPGDVGVEDPGGGVSE